MKNYFEQKIKKIEDEAQRIEKENKEKDRKFQEHSQEIRNLIKEQDKSFTK